MKMSRYDAAVRAALLAIVPALVLSSAASALCSLLGW